MQHKIKSDLVISRSIHCSSERNSSPVPAVTLQSHFPLPWVSIRRAEKVKKRRGKGVEILIWMLLSCFASSYLSNAVSTRLETFNHYPSKAILWVTERGCVIMQNCFLSSSLKLPFGEIEINVMGWFDLHEMWVSGENQNFQFSRRRENAFKTRHKEEASSYDWNHNHQSDSVQV